MALRASVFALLLAAGANATECAPIAGGVPELAKVDAQVRLRHAPPGTDVCALLADAEGLLVRDVKSAAFGKSALTHAGNFLFNIGVGLVLGVAFHHWTQAAIQSLAGIAVGEVMIISQPAE